MKRFIRSSIMLGAVALGTSALAASFTAGNLVIYREGTVSGSLTNVGSVVFLDEYTTNGTLVQSVMMPTNYFGAYSSLLANGTAFGNGLITRSVDGRFILVGGYGARLGQFSSSLGTKFATDAPRVVALVDGSANVDTTTCLTNSAADGQELRSPASTDGTNLWVGGGTSGGFIAYTVRGSNDATVLSGLNTRQLEIYNNQLYLTAGNLGGIGQTGQVAILTNAFGTTLPTATNGAGTLAFLPASTNVFSGEAFAAFKLKAGGADPIDTFYILDGGSLSAGAAKFSLVGGNWVFNGTVGFPQSLVGLAANVITSGSTTNVNIYVTGGGSTLTGGDSVYKATDATGYNGTPTNSSFSPFIGPTPNGRSLRGLVFTPSAGSDLALPSGSGRLSVGPVIDVFASALSGCPDVTETDVYSLANPGTSSIGWTANVDSNWVSLSANSGTLGSLASANVTVTLNGNVTSLTAATNTAKITFSNTVSAATTTPAVTLF